MHVDNENALYTQYRKCSKDFVDVQYSYYIHLCEILSRLELHPSYSNTHAHDVGAHAYYSNSVVTRAVRSCFSGNSGYSCYSDSLLENDRSAHKDHAMRVFDTGLNNVRRLYYERVIH